MKNASAVCSANQIQCFFPASAVRVKEQSNTMTKRSETNMLFWHICHLGCLKRAPPAGDVCDSVCVMNCAGIFAHICCGYFKQYGNAYHQHIARGEAYYVASMSHMQRLHASLCVNSRAVSGVVVPEALLNDRCFPGPARFPCTPEALVQSEPGLPQAWLKDAPLISPVRQSVNSLWLTSTGPAN